MHDWTKSLHMNLLIQSLINNTMCVVNQLPNNNLRILLPINNSSATYRLLINESEPVSTTYMLPINNKSTNNNICASLFLIPLLIYKSLITLLTKSLLFWLLINNNNQVDATSFQSISLTNMNLTTIKPTFIFNPNLPIQPL